MKHLNLLTKTGNYWHFHPIGTGVIFTYHKQAKQILITCVATGTLIQVINKYEEGGYETPKDFKKDATDTYMDMVSTDNVSMDLSFYENPTYIGESMVEVDFKILAN